MLTPYEGFHRTLSDKLENKIGKNRKNPTILKISNKCLAIFTSLDDEDEECVDDIDIVSFKFLFIGLFILGVM